MIVANNADGIAVEIVADDLQLAVDCAEIKLRACGHAVPKAGPDDPGVLDDSPAVHEINNTATRATVVKDRS
jgi:hypothetical protein